MPKLRTASLTLPCWILLLTVISPASATEAGDRYQCSNEAPDLAIPKCLELLRVYPRDSGLHISLGKALESLGQHDEAVEVYRQGLQYVPGDPDLRKYYSIARSQQEEAGFMARRREARKKTGSPTSVRLETLRCVGKTGTEALAACDRALELDPNLTEVLKRRGSLLRATGRTLPALESYQRAVRLQPGDDESRAAVAELQARARRERQATASTTKASSPVARQVQQLLKQLGYDPGPVDGQPGARTTRAVKSYQRDRGVPADGVVSEKLLVQLRASTTLAAGRSTQPVPEQPPAIPSGSLIQARLQLLRRLLEQGLIDQSEFDRQQSALLRQN